MAEVDTWDRQGGEKTHSLQSWVHGFATIVPDENHPVSSFMDSFYINWESQMTVVPNLKNTAEQADDAMLLRVLSINYESLLNIIHGKRVMS